jgi:thymidine kinase
MVNNARLQRGMFELYCGPMFSGKTQAMKIKLHTLKYREDVEYLFFRPSIDNRNEETRPSRIKFDFEETFIDANNPLEMLNYFDRRYNLVAIDEIMLFSKDITTVIEELQREKAHIIAAGLDSDFRGEPFGEMGKLLVLADYVEKLTGICTHNGCNAEATKTQRLINGQPAHYSREVISIEGSKDEETYTCRCPDHHIVPGKPAYHSRS